MNIIDIIIQFLNYLIQHLLLPIMPNEIPAFPLDAFVAHLDAIKNTIVNVFSGWGAIFPIDLIFSLLLVVIGAELILFGYHIICALINLFTGQRLPVK